MASLSFLASLLHPLNELLLLEVSGVVYKMEQHRPVARWPFIVSAHFLESEALSSVIHNNGKNQGISDRVKELGMHHFQIKLQHRKLTPRLRVVGFFLRKTSAGRN